MIPFLRGTGCGRLHYHAPMPGALLLDLYNTLIDGGSTQRRDEVNAAMGADVGADPQRFAAAYRETYRQRFLGATGDVEATVRAVAIAAGALPTAAQMRLAATRRRTLARELLWPSPGTLEALDELHTAGWRLGLVTNCSAETPEQWKRTPFATRFDALGFSCELGVAKPNPAIYLAVCSFLNVAPTDCVYVGDGADDELSGAAKLGMSVIRTVEFQPSSSTWPRSRIERLSELPALIGRPLRSPRSADPA
jgi:putative hydrolase of the HAD superfamily